MPVDGILPLVYVQDMGPTAKLAHDASVRPEATQAMAKVLADEMLREEKEQVQKSQPGEQSAAAGTDKDGQGRGAMQQEQRQAGQGEDNAPTPEGLDPFVGKLINRKI